MKTNIDLICCKEYYVMSNEYSSKRYKMKLVAADSLIEEYVFEMLDEFGTWNLTIKGVDNLNSKVFDIPL
jgi:hypothetical protein